MSRAGENITEISIDSDFGLIDTLRITKGDVISIVGGGGKTTTLFGIASELRRRGFTVVVTTTTHLQTPRSSTTMPPMVSTEENENWLEVVKAKIHVYGSATVVGKWERNDKLGGLEFDQIDSLRGIVDCVVLEADGARGRSLKAPASYEPVIPGRTRLTMAPAGLDVVGMPLEEKIVHRMEAILKLTKIFPGEPITERVVAETLARGYRSSIPANSRWVCFLNKAYDKRLRMAEKIGRLLIAEGVPEVIFGEAIQPQGCFYRMAPVIR